MKFDFTKAIKDASKIAIKALQEELDNQGHNATGSLSKQIKSSISTSKDGARAEVSLYLYGAYVNFGVKKSRFRFGGVKHIANLVKWIRAKGITPSNLTTKKFAWAIVKKHAKEGIPTASSYAFSNNGKRLGFVDDAFSSAEKEILNLVTPDYIDVEITLNLVP